MGVEGDEVNSHECGEDVGSVLKKFRIGKEKAKEAAQEFDR